MFDDAVRVRGEAGFAVMTDEAGRLTRQQAAIRSFTLFALQSKEISATMARAVDLVTGELATPIGALVRGVAPGRAAVVHARGRVRLAPGETFAVDPELLAAQVSRLPLGSEVLSAKGSAGPPAPRGRGATLSVLVVVEGLPWGRLLVSDTRPHAFDEVDTEFLQIVAEILGAALERHRVDRGNDVLAAFTRFVLQSTDDASTVDRAIATMRQVAETPMGALVRIAPDRRRAPTLVQSSGGPAVDPGCGLDDPRIADSLLRPEPLVIEDARTDARFAAHRMPTTGRPIAYLAPAVQVDGRIWGRLVAGDTRPRRFSAREIELASAVADVLAATLRNDWREPTRRADALHAARRRGVGGPQTTEVALLDRDGVIVWVNRAWLDFSRANGGDPLRTGVGNSYLARCEAADDPLSRDVAAAIREAAAGGLPAPMRLVIPCHSPRTARWFDVLVSSRLADDGTCVGVTVSLSLAEE